MNNPHPHSHGGPQLVDHHSKAPAWKRLHRSPFFWVAAFFIMVAMSIYVLTGNLSRGPGDKPVPAVAP